MTRFLILLALTGVLNAQISKSEIRSLFNFKPSQITSEEMKVKSKELDKFWDKIKKDTAKSLPALRLELLSNDNPPFFYSDCAKLLLKLTDNDNDRRVAYQAMMKCDVGDAHKRDFLFITQFLALKGLNTVPLAFRIMDYPAFSVFLPEHFFRLGSGDCFLFAVLANHRNYFVPAIIDSFQNGLTNESKKVILFRSLWYSIDCKADSIIQDAILEDTLLAGYYQRLSERISFDPNEFEKDDFYRDYVKQFIDKTFDELDLMRRKRVMGLSDEMIGDLDLMNYYMRQRRNCR